MAADFSAACRLENLAGLQNALAERLRSLGVSPELSRGVLAAAGQAFGALCLAKRPGEALTTLERTRGELCLRLVFMGEEEPPGLAASLYCPPALRVAFRRSRGRGVWTAFWEE
ncbi:hypothetical protein AAU61_08600 [Desulfocarbo indianensis]|nr:hypothetical protein AAU61_08600 [Desulfocarbo indianensis]